MIRASILEVYRLCGNTLEARGYTLNEQPMTEGFVDEMARAGKAPSSQIGNFDLDPGKSFWLALRRQETGELVGTLAARVDFHDNPRRKLRDDMVRHWAPEGVDVSLCIPDHVSMMLKGFSVYMGDIFFKEGSTGDKQKTFAFLHAAHSLAFAKWPSSGAIYGYMRMADCIASSSLWGFTSCTVPNVAQWSEELQYRSPYESLTILTRQDFEVTADCLLRNPEVFDELPSRRHRPSAKPGGQADSEPLALMRTQ